MNIKIETARQENGCVGIILWVNIIQETFREDMSSAPIKIIQ